MFQLKVILDSILSAIKWPFSNFYTGVFTAFLIWVVFIDANDLPSMIRNSWKLREVESEITFFKERIVQVVEEKKELEGNALLQEQFAREKFFMKKADEEIFLVVPATD